MIITNNLFSQIITPSFGLFTALGYLFSLFILFFIDKQKFLFNNIFYTLILFAYVFLSKIGYSFFYDTYYLFDIDEGGSLLGGIFLATIIFIVLSKYRPYFLYKINKYILPFLSILPISKIGCFYTGCCWGTLNIYNILIPVQLLESFLYFNLFLLLFIKFRNNQRLLYYFLLGFSTIRTISEQFRDDQTIFIGIIPLTQIIAFSIFIYSIYYLIATRNKS